MQPSRLPVTQEGGAGLKAECLSPTAPIVGTIGGQERKFARELPAIAEAATTQARRLIILVARRVVLCFLAVIAIL